MSNAADFIGRGIMFPMRVDQTGSIALSSGADDLGSSIHMVLATAPGERLMRPKFGCRIWELMFEPINANTIGLMGVAVRDALGQWEPRIDVEDVEVVPDTGADGKVDIRVTYRVRSSNDHRNLVFPFYVIPKEDEQ
ncbi:MAG TPA: GPW/gp25 family protein [Ilumatobacteraceae bacterium]|nr:GPW/gp25 family protein [Ilumatobacteraceae bacterium]HRB02098.1 GPW/gp25 family protein [Ilumatobacteraceae bacterium]